MRIALREQRGGSSGVVMCDIEVPDPAKALPAMSGVILGAASAARTPSLNADDRLAAGLDGARPTTARTFARGDIVRAFVEVSAGPKAGPIAITTTVRDAQGQVVLTRDATAVETAGQPAREALELPIDAAPGRYVVRFEARTGTLEPIAREAWFEIAEPPR